MATKPSNRTPGSGSRKGSTSDTKGKVPNDEDKRNSSGDTEVPFMRSVGFQSKTAAKRNFPSPVSNNPSDSSSTSKRSVEEEFDAHLGGVVNESNEKLRVCLLDDSHVSSQEILALLDESKCKIDHFYSAEDAYRALFKNEYDIFVSTQATGVDVTTTENLIRILKSSDKLEKMRLSVVVVTSDVSEKNVTSLRDAGADDVLLKPLQADLSDALDAVVAKKKVVAEPEVKPMMICLLEDSFAVSQVIVSKLTASGHTVEHFHAAGQVFEAISNKSFDALMLSQKDDNALECAGLILTLRSAKEIEQRKLPIIVLVQNTSAENIQSLTSAGANHVVAKYVDEEVNNKIFEVVNTLEIPKAQRVSQLHPVRTDRAESAIKPSAVVSTQEQKPEKKSSLLGSRLSGKRKRRKKKPMSETNDLSLDFSIGNALPDSPALEFDDLESNTAPTQSVKKPSKQRVGLNFKGLFHTIGVRVLPVVLVVALVGAAAAWYYLDTTPVKVVAVQEGALSKVVVGSGRVVARKRVNLTSSFPGQITKVYAEEGDKVKKGAVLAMLDDREAIVAINRAKAELANAKSDVELKQRTLNQLKAASKSGGISSAMIEDVEASLSAAVAMRRVSEEDLNAARVQRERLKIEAPFAGTISQSYAIEGIWSEPPGTLFALVDTSRLELAVKVDGIDAQDVSVNQIVTMNSSAFPGNEWKGKIVRLDSRIEDLPMNRRGTVYASLGPNAPRLRYGQQVEAQITTESTEDAIKLPFEAVFEKDGKNVVLLVDDGRVTFQPVEIGIQAFTEVEIVKGIKTGQLVALHRGNLQEGQRVSPKLVKLKDADSTSFPYREKYADVSLYSLEGLKKYYNDVLIVDVRSKFEYDVVHISKAKHIPLSDKGFATKLEKLRGKSKAQPIVFYCNGHTCTKSYKAAKKAQAAGFKYVYAYDAGIKDWMKNNKKNTTLLGVSPAPREKMVSDQYFQSRLIDYKEFETLSSSRGALVVDIRDEAQRQTTVTMDTVELPLDQFLSRLKAGEYKDKQLLIFDAVGKQIRWLQYVMKDRGYKDYFFLKGGIGSISG